jgi:hypothetical protein
LDAEADVVVLHAALGMSQIFGKGDLDTKKSFDVEQRTLQRCYSRIASSAPP